MGISQIMQVVYYKKLDIILSDYRVTTAQTPKIAAYVKKEHCFYCAI